MRFGLRLRRRIEKHQGDQPQIVPGADRGIDRHDDRQLAADGLSLRPRGQKQVELAQEAGRRRQAREAEQANRQQQCDGGVIAIQSAQIVVEFAAADPRGSPH